MNFRTSRGAAKVLFLLPALVIALGLGFYLHHTGKLDLSVLRKWQIEATNFYNKSTGKPGQVPEKILTVDFDELSGALTEAQVGERYRSLELSCYSVKGPFGDIACTTPVALFNDTRSRTVTFLFLRDRLTNLRVTFEAAQQQDLAARLQGRYGPPARLGVADPQTGRNLTGWKIAAGTLAVSETVPGDRETVLLWMANTGSQSGKR